MLRPLFSKVAGRLLALTSESCDGLARQQSETVWASQMSSMKLSSHSSRNAKLRPISKRKLSSFRRSLKVVARRIADSSSINAVSFSFARTTKRFPSSQCASAIQIVRPLESMAETQPQLVRRKISRLPCRETKSRHTVKCDG